MTDEKAKKPKAAKATTAKPEASKKQATKKPGAKKQGTKKPVAKKTAAKKVATKKVPAQKSKKTVDDNQGDLLDALDIGRRLERARKAQKMTLSQAARKTQIRAETLEALEQNRFEELPELVYVRGFIRIYAQVLELDAQDLLSDLGRYLQTEEKTTLTLPTPVEQGALPTMKVIFASLLVVVLMGAIWWTVDRPSHDVIGPNAAVPETDGYNAMPDVMKPNATEAQPATAFDRPINLDTVEEKPIQTATQYEPTMEAPATIEASTPVVLKAVDDVWVSVYREGASLPVFAKVLVAGEEYAVPHEDDLLLDVGLPPALIVYVNGERKGVSGIIDRRVRGLSLNPEYLNNIYYPQGVFQEVNIKLPTKPKTAPEPETQAQKAIVEVPSVVIQEESVPDRY